MSSVFFDANVWLPALMTDGFCRRLIAGVQARATVIVSLELIDEVAVKLAVKFRVGWDTIAAAKALMSVSGRVFSAEVVPYAGSPDPNDSVLLAQGVAAGCEAFVTLDGPLLEPGQIEGMRILAPSKFAAELRLS